MEDYPVIFFEKAQNDLDQILLYYFKETNTTQVSENFMSELKNKLKYVSSFPEAWSKKQKFLLGVRRLSIFSRYSIYYLPNLDKKRIDILRILHNSRDIGESYFEN